MEVSKKAEKTAIDALNAAKRAEATANKSIAATNRVIETANKAVATTNKAIAEINRLAEKLKREREEEKRKKKVETYRVKRGDSLTRIALKIYKDASLWKKLFNANRDKIKRPSLIRPGQVLKVPR
ncbi:MAG: LysM peptidoglycan-binding domain-containing protein [Candidatus Omnitrophica bacterium]|nr:LysM peptidoglycan-binding domain-containing protein [Candidatus Omnitrophota bacterium]